MSCTSTTHLIALTSTSKYTICILYQIMPQDPILMINPCITGKLDQAAPTDAIGLFGHMWEFKN